ncbi:hypothetical protein BDV37DRAFT_59603 [Aspergillus pseudonomiae]|uniref:Uncharacterized protein n=1 Tax=Aspergillus pseudonomiae TaxID=1506151 RepID=A0A5N7CUC9_9EURO|nr:uncharacterized protein BDV37DRAFT_59603 [Aspergillus pseudonomiae]KAE8397337.1 hypothetical protein BDV37DRAFT_59603 [Aspergillus pseudonomiae]
MKVSIAMVVLTLSSLTHLTGATSSAMVSNSGSLSNPVKDEQVDKPAGPLCYNRQNKSKGAGCTVSKGFGYSSAHNCVHNMYSCQGENGKVECLSINNARRSKLKGGYCYK